MAFHRAILNDTNELVGYEEVAEPNWTPSPKRVPVHDRDLVPHRYYWNGEAFVPLALGGEDEIRARPRLIKAVVHALIDLDDALPEGQEAESPGPRRARSGPDQALGPRA